MQVYVSNEEKKLLDKIAKPCYEYSITEREQFIANLLVKKNLLNRAVYKGSVVYIPNEKFR